jgi:flagellar operon protein
VNIDEIALNQPLGPVGPGGRAAGPPKPTIGPSFDQVLQDKLATTPTAPEKLTGPPRTAAPPPDIKLSAHAQQRLASRQINLDQKDWERIHAGIEKAAAKGSKDALVMSDKAALVVSIKNRTVITAVDPASLKENVFTNIDSAVIV